MASMACRFRFSTNVVLCRTAGCSQTSWTGSPAAVPTARDLRGLSDLVFMNFHLLAVGFADTGRAQRETADPVRVENIRFPSVYGDGTVSDRCGCDGTSFWPGLSRASFSSLFLSDRCCRMPAA